MSVLRFLRETALDFCLGCRHDHLTRPFTIEQESYMVCLDCGRQLFYSVETMRRISGRELRRLRAARTPHLTPQPIARTSGNDSGLAA
ncbi:MAG TPA: hypothetical protein VGD62_09110 [Acidobacteriaceae bacterium]